MGTTVLYVELIIIGLETALWIAAFLIYVVDIQYVLLIEKFLGIIPASILLLGILYILGVIADRVADSVFNRTEQEIKDDCELQTKSGILIWKASGQEEYFKFTRSKIRILRASTLNLPLFTFFTTLDVSCYCSGQTHLLESILILGTIFSYFSWHGYKCTAKKYYKKEKILEDDLKRKENANQTKLR